MIMKKLLIGCVAAIAVLASLAGCDQNRVMYSGPSYLMFSDTLYEYIVQESNEKFDIPVSATARAGYDRTFAVEVIDKESNAVEGKHYKLLSNTVTIKAGEMAANVEVESMYENIDKHDSLGFALRLVVPESEQWEMYGTKTKVVIHKYCPFDINNYSGFCKVTSTYFSSYLGGIKLRLITSDVVEDEENTIVLHGLFYDGFDTKVKFKPDNIEEADIEIEEHVCGSTSEAFGTIYGNGKMMMTQPSGYPAYYNTCDKFIFMYINVRVDNKDGSLYGVVDTPANVVEWISEAEAEKLREQGY